MNHDHDTTDDRDECTICGELICPDCGDVVIYEDDDYRHRGDNATLCFLARVR